MELRQIVIHSPGPNWKTGVDFREQPGVKEHVLHYSKLHEQGKLQFGGPFVDYDSGGMMMCTEAISREEIENYAASDPAVRSGLLNYKVMTWYLAMSKEGS